MMHDIETIVLVLIVFLLFSFTNLVGICGELLLSIALGRKESKKASHIFAVTLMLAVVFTAIIVLFGLLFAKPLFILSSGTNLEVLNYALSYFENICLVRDFKCFPFLYRVLFERKIIGDYR